MVSKRTGILTARVPNETLAALRRLSVKTGVPLSQLVARVLADWIDKGAGFSQEEKRK